MRIRLSVFGVVVCICCFCSKRPGFCYVSEVGHFHLILGCNDFEAYTRAAGLNLLKGR